jgi:hypothetical protein
MLNSIPADSKIDQVTTVSINIPDIKEIQDVISNIKQIIQSQEPLLCYALSIGSIDCALILSDFPGISFTEEMPDGNTCLMLSVKV